MSVFSDNSLFFYGVEMLPVLLDVISSMHPRDLAPAHRAGA